MSPDEISIREPDQIRQDCVRKVRAVKVSDHFQAILGCLLGEDWTTPRLIEMVITPDDHILGRCDGDPSFKAFGSIQGRPCIADEMRGGGLQVRPAL